MISEKALMDRLQRIESRMVRGFSEMGVRVTDDDDWFKVNEDTSEVLLKSPGKSIASIWLAMRAAGCRAGKQYHLKIRGEYVGSLYVEEKT
jgi:uncharacterized membrane protein